MDSMKSTLLSFSMQDLMNQLIPITIHLLVALVIGYFIFVTYKFTYRGVAYSRNFNISLVVITIVTSLVIMVIGSNIALSLGMVGALSIVRFRTAVKDPRDTSFIFWGIAVGLSCGVGSYVIAIVGSVFVGVFLFGMSVNKNQEDKYLLVIRGNVESEQLLYDTIFKAINRYRIRARNMNKDQLEIICEIRLNKKGEIELVQALKELRGVATVNLVMQNGETLG